MSQMKIKRYTHKLEAQLARKVRHGNLAFVTVIVKVPTQEIIAVACNAERAGSLVESLGLPEGSWEIKDFRVYV